MELSDHFLRSNRDWDPGYLQEVMDQDFYDFSDLWLSLTSDRELVDVASNVEKYVPVVEDISIEDSVLCQAVESIEKE